MTLEEAFYIIGIITMTIMLLLMIGLVTAVFIIKAKINHLHRMVEDKVNTVATVARTAKNIFSKVKK